MYCYTGNRGCRPWGIEKDSIKLCIFYTIGKRFASPIKSGPRAKRSRRRSEQRQLDFSRISATPSSRRSVTPAAPPATTPVTSHPTHSQSPRLQLHSAEAGEQLETDYGVHELPCTDNPPQRDSSSIVVNRALLALIEVLEAEHDQLQSKSREKHYFRLEDI